MADDGDHPPLHTSDEREPVGQIGPEVWLVAPETRRLMTALSGEGARTRFVGGCVRDALMRRTGSGPFDIDIATTLHPQQVLERLSAAGFEPRMHSAEHGAVRVEQDPFSYEITTLRKDIRCDGRHAEVVFTDRFFDDAMRRDFTVNALYADADGMVTDYVDGLRDLAHGRIRFVGRPMERIAEDYLRILRFFRFYAWLGRPPADANAVSACQAQAEGLDQLSAERVRREFLRLMEAPDPCDALAIMRGTRILERILPAGADIAALRVLVMMENRGVSGGILQPDAIRRIACLVGAGGADPAVFSADAFARLNLTAAEARRLEGLLSSPADLWPDPSFDGARVRVLLDQLGREAVIDRVVLKWAVERSDAAGIRGVRTEAWLSLLEAARSWNPPPFPLNGRDVLAWGLTGEEVGATLRGLRRLWVESGGVLSRDELLGLWQPEVTPRRFLDGVSR